MSIASINPMIVTYFDRKMLAKMGCQTDIDELTDFEVACYRIIENEVNKETEKELKKKK